MPSRINFNKGSDVRTAGRDEYLLGQIYYDYQRQMHEARLRGDDAWLERLNDSYAESLAEARARQAENEAYDRKYAELRRNPPKFEKKPSRINMMMSGMLANLLGMVK